MVLPDDEVKLLDFGIAKALAEDSTEMTAGTRTLRQIVGSMCRSESRSSKT